MKIVIITQGLSRIVDPIVTSPHDVCLILDCGGRSNSYRYPWFNGVTHLLKRYLLNLPDLQGYCGERSISYAKLTKANMMAVPDILIALAPDIIIVHSMSFLLPEKIFEIPKFGIINLHTSLLPAYRGPNPDFWHYYDGATEHGCTVHFIDKGEDTGDIICQEGIKLPQGLRSEERLNLLVGEIGVRLLLKSLELIVSPKFRAIPQVRVSPTQRARNLDKCEHLSIIDWNTFSTESIWNILRGTEGWLDAVEQPSGFLIGQRWRVEDFYLGRVCNLGLPGEIKRFKGGALLICRDGIILLSTKFHLRDFVRYILVK